MGQQANITVFDGAGTPVSHTLVADGIETLPNGSVAHWKETLASVPDYAQVRLHLKKELLKSGVTKVSVTLEVPVMESISGQNSAGYTAAPKVAYVDREDTVFYCHPRSTETGRRLVSQMLANAKANVSTSVTPVTAGPIAELLQKLVQVN